MVVPRRWLWHLRGKRGAPKIGRSACPDLRPAVDSDPKPLRAALIGYGFAGKTFHAPLINAVPGLALNDIVSRDPLRVHSDWPEVNVVAAPDDVFRNPEIDLIAIA